MRIPLLHALGAVLAILLAAGVASIGVSTVGPPRVGTSGAAPDVPDTLLLVNSSRDRPPGLTRNEVLLLEPGTGAYRPLLDGAQAPVVAPDGHELYFVQHREEGDQVRIAVVALAADTHRLLWSADVAAQPTAETAEKPLSVLLAATRDRVYVARHAWQSGDPISVLALDLVDGLELGRWSVDFEGRTAIGIRLFAAPDGSRLYLLAFDPGPPHPVSPRPAEVLYVRFHLPDGHEEARHLGIKQPDGSALGWDVRMTADGSALYHISPAADGSPARVDFFDLTTATVERVPLSFQGGPEFLPLEHGIAPDGRRLFVLAPTLGELAMVDLVQRRLEETVLVDTRAVARGPAPSVLARAWGFLADLLVREAWAKPYFQGSLLVAPDGRRIYTVGATGKGAAARADGIWAIATSNWWVTEHWVPGIEPSKLVLDGDGRYLFVQQGPVWPGDRADPMVLRVLDTATGAAVLTTDTLPASQLYALADLYRDTYGRSPGAVGQVQATLPEPVAAMVAEASPTTVVGGDVVTIAVRFVAPGTDRTVAPGEPGVRYEAPARVTATLTPRHRLLEARTITLDAAGYGVYRGSTDLPSPGSWSDGTWSVEAIAEWQDGLRRRALLNDAVVVQPAFAGSDGRRCIFLVSSDPPRPVVDQWATLRVAVVDAETRGPLPAGVALADGLPEELEATLYGYGVTTVRPRPVRHGVYEGPVRLWSATTWRVWLHLNTAADPAARFFSAGAVQAVDW